LPESLVADLRELLAVFLRGVVDVAVEGLDEGVLTGKRPIHIGVVEDTFGPTLRRIARETKVGKRGDVSPVHNHLVASYTALQHVKGQEVPLIYLFAKSMAVFGRSEPFVERVGWLICHVQQVDR
jgi:hypothetical protein